MNNENNNRKKPVKGKDYKVEKTNDGRTTIHNLRHPANKKQEESNDILSMIRARQEGTGDYKPSTDSTKLREFLNNLDKETCEEDYKDTPIYKLGHEDGYELGYSDGYQEAYYELFKVLKAIETIIEPHTKQSC
jgi:flagellar biosynthesis/type III secretory pathway protein FliH